MYGCIQRGHAQANLTRTYGIHIYRDRNEPEEIMKAIIYHRIFTRHWINQMAFSLFVHESELMDISFYWNLSLTVQYALPLTHICISKPTIITVGQLKKVTAVTFFPARPRPDQRGTTTGEIRKVPVYEITWFLDCRMGEARSQLGANNGILVCLVREIWQFKLFAGKEVTAVPATRGEGGYSRRGRRLLCLCWNWIALSFLTHWGRMTHICVAYLTIIVSDNGLSPSRHQAIIWTNAGILLIRPLGTNFNEILIEIHTFSFKKMHSKMSSAKRRPFSLGLNVLKHWK